MPAPLIAKVDRLLPPVTGEPPAHFYETVAGLPGLEAAHFLSSPDGTQRLGIWLWRGREGMQEGHAALAAAMSPLGPPPMIEERVLDVVATYGSIDGGGATDVRVVHLGPFASAAARQAHLDNIPRVQVALEGIGALRCSLALSDPAGRDLVAVHFWDACPDVAAVRAAIQAQPMPDGLDGTLLGEPSYVEAYQAVRSIRPAVTA